MDGCIEDVIHEVCSPKNIQVDLENERIPASPNLKVALSVHITLNRKCREHMPATVQAEVKH